MKKIKAMVRSGKKVGLLDHMGGGNLGDDATFDAVMQNIQKRWPDSVIVAFSMNPSDTQRRQDFRSTHSGARPGISAISRWTVA